jgi:hypothetical protein
MQPRSQVSSSWEDQPVSPSRGYPVIPEGVMEAAAVGPLMECPTCGRSFNENAFAKHAKVRTVTLMMLEWVVYSSCHLLPHHASACLTWLVYSDSFVSTKC